MRLVTVILLAVLSGCQSFNSLREPAGKSADRAAHGGRMNRVQSPATAPESAMISLPEDSPGAVGANKKQTAYRASRDYGSRGNMNSLVRAKVQPSRLAPLRDRVLFKQSNSLSVADRKEVLHKRYASRTPQAAEECNSVQVGIRTALQEEFNQYRSLRSVSMGTNQSLSAVTQSRLSYLNTSRSVGLSSTILQDQANIIAANGAYPRRVELSQRNQNDSVMIVGRNGYNIRLSSQTLSTHLANTLNGIGQAGGYVQAVELSKSTDGYVVIGWPGEAYLPGDYSIYYTYNVPANLTSRLENLYQGQRMVSLVALGPVRTGQVEAPWIVITEKNISYTSNVDADIVQELEFLQSIDARIEQIEFDRQGGVILSYSFDDLPFSQSVIQFQVAESYPVHLPKINYQHNGSIMNLSFETLNNNQTYTLQESTDLQNWTDVQTSLGDGGVRTYSSSMNTSRKFWRVSVNAISGTCPRLATIFGPDISYVKYPKTLECRLNGGVYRPYNTFKSRYLGREGYGFTTKALCDQVVADATQYAVCSWNGMNYSPYNSETNQPIGLENYGYQTSQECRTATLNSSGSVMCNWNGTRFMLYQAINSKEITTAGNGYTSLSLCTQATSTARVGLVCGAMNASFTPYYVDGGRTFGKTGSAFANLPNCLSSIQRASSFFACNWNGSTFQPYSVNNNTPVFTGNIGLANLDQCQQTTEKSTYGVVCNRISSSKHAMFTYQTPAIPGVNYNTFELCKAAQ